MQSRYIVVVFAVLFSLPTVAASANDAAETLDVSPITQNRLRAHVNFLASDELEGREATHRGGKVAGLYVASHFQRLGLEPATGFVKKGDRAVASAAKASESESSESEASTSGSSKSASSTSGAGEYFQPFRLSGSQLNDVVLQFDDKAFSVGEDFSLFPFTGSGDVTAELTFCGYGITAPEFEYDDYDGVDVEGKVVLVFRHEPAEKTAGDWFAGATHSAHALFRTKFDNAVKHGAAGIILVNDPLHCSTQRHFGVDGGRAISGLHREKPEKSADATEGKQAPIPYVFGGKPLADFLETRLSLRTLQEEIDRERKPRSRPSGVTVKLKLTREELVLPTGNVAAALRGSDPVLRDEWVVVGAHFDHEGMRGGKVMNGANDNASGSAALLMIAELLARQPTPPKRSVLFIGFDAEEKGLLGSRYYVEHPLVPLENTVAMLNMDMVGRSTKNTVLAAGGFSSRVLDRVCRTALKRAGITEPDFGGERVNARSDHYPFFKRKIPVLVFHSDDMGDYHEPTDDVDKITYPMMQRITKAVAYAVWETANSAERPRFGRVRSF